MVPSAYIYENVSSDWNLIIIIIIIIIIITFYFLFYFYFTTMSDYFCNMFFVVC